jgi:hypothetical protein
MQSQHTMMTKPQIMRAPQLPLKIKKQHQKKQTYPKQIMTK